MESAERPTEPCLNRAVSFTCLRFGNLWQDVGDWSVWARILQTYRESAFVHSSIDRRREKSRFSWSHFHSDAIHMLVERFTGNASLFLLAPPLPSLVFCVCVCVRGFLSGLSGVIQSPKLEICTNLKGKSSDLLSKPDLILKPHGSMKLCFVSRLVLGHD